MPELRARILRGATQIGGSCAEVEYDRVRLVIDVGLPLERVDRFQDLLPDVPGLWASGDSSLRAALVSHTHPDHCGLADLIAPDVPIICGRAAQQIWNAASLFIPRMEPFEASAHFEHGVPLNIGPFRVTPWLVDHSGYDAYSLLIEAGGRRLLYSGDIRATGRKASTLDAIAAGARGVDVLLLEGTRIGGSGNPVSESDVEAEVAELLRGTPGLGLVFFSAMNIDRLVSVYGATLKADRTFVMDLYTASVARATGNPRVPQAEWDRVRVYLPRAQRRRVIDSENFALVDSVRSARIYPDEIKSRVGELVMITRASMLPELHHAVDDAVAIWSMWDGYLDRDSALVGALRGYGVPMHRVHASGHASRATLRQFAAAAGPGTIVPIHTDRPTEYHAVFENVRTENDGEWWSV
jgi:ribonuclease J